MSVGAGNELRASASTISISVEGDYAGLGKKGQKIAGKKKRKKENLGVEFSPDLTITLSFPSFPIHQIFSD